MKTAPLYQALARTVDARARCIEKGNDEWEDKHSNRLDELVKAHMPRGSGFNIGTELDLDKSSGDKLVFHTSFHHMDEHGYYSGWTSHDVIVKPSLAHGFTVRVTGRNTDSDIKDYIAETFSECLATSVE